MPLPTPVMKWAGVETPTEGALTTTSKFTDVAVGDTSTYEEGLGPAQGSPCGAGSYRPEDAWINGVADFGDTVDLSAATWQFTHLLTEDSAPVPCGIPDPGSKPADTLYYDVSYASLYGAWTVITSGSIGLSGTTGAAFGGILARYIRVRINYEKWVFDANGAFGVPTKNSVARISDLRITEGIPDPVEIEDDYEEEVTEGRCRVSLSWTEAILATAYELERRRPSSDWGNIYTGATNEYSDTSAEIGQDYYYRVRATNGDLVSEWSETFVVSSACQAHWDVNPIPVFDESRSGRRCRPDGTVWRKRR
jgi:hypothetical protein